MSHFWFKPFLVWSAYLEYCIKTESRFLVLIKRPSLLTSRYLPSLLSLRYSSGLFLLCLFCAPVQAIELEVPAEVPDELATNIKTSVAKLSTPQECILSQRYENRVRAAVEQALQGLAFYRYEVLALEPNKQKDKCETWRLDIRVGDPVRVSALNLIVSGTGSELPAIAKAASEFPLKVGDRLDHRRYEQGKRVLKNAAILNGYLDAQWKTARLNISQKHNDAKVELIFVTGKRYYFGELVDNLTESDKVLVSGFKPFKTGDPYTSEQLNLYSQRLKESGYFETIMVRPLLHQAKEYRVPVELVYRFRPKNEYAVGGGINSDTGPRAKASWKRSRLNSAGHSIEAEALVSAPLQSLGIRYRIPLKDPAQNFISVQSGFRRFDDNDTESEILSFSVKRHWWQDNSDWQYVAHLRAEQERFVQGSDDRQTTSLLLPGGTVNRFRSDGEIYPLWGDRQLVTFELGDAALGSDIDIARITLQSRWLRSFGNLRILTRLELGALASNDFSQVPASMRFFAGGDQSIRGFGFQAISPVDEFGELTGGRYLYTMSSELSVPVADNWRLATFFDAGNASEGFLENLATGVGAGVHWLTPIGPVRLYIARGNSNIENGWRLHFSLGAAL